MKRRNPNKAKKKVEEKRAEKAAVDSLISVIRSRITFLTPEEKKADRIFKEIERDPSLVDNLSARDIDWLMEVAEKREHEMSIYLNVLPLLEKRREELKKK